MRIAVSLGLAEEIPGYPVVAEGPPPEVYDVTLVLQSELGSDWWVKYNRRLNPFVVVDSIEAKNALAIFEGR